MDGLSNNISTATFYKKNIINNLSLAAIIAALILFVFNSLTFAQFDVPKDLVKLQTFQSFDKVYAGGELKLALKVNIDDSWHINSNKPYDDFMIPTAVSVSSSDSINIVNVVYPEPHDLKLSFSETPLSVWEGEIYIGVLLSVPKDILPGKYSFIVNLKYQACNNSTCLPPRSVKDTVIIEVAGKNTAVKEINQDIFKNINMSYTPLSVKTEAANASGGNAISNTLEKNGIIFGLLFVFIGGLALNLTPCVYPLIPITIGYFGGQSEGSTKKLFTMGVLFVLGLSITYSVIGVVTALSGSIFGALLQNTYVVIFIALVFIILSLSMFGVYEFKLPDALVAKAGSAKSGMFGAFFMGLTMGIVAAPCIGPFVLGLVTYVAAKADPFYGFLLFFVLAMGLGFPYLILAVFSGKIKKLPRAGEWMDSVKHIFGFILIAMAVYFLLPLLPKSFSGYLLPAYGIIIGLYILLFDKLANKIRGFRIFKIAFSVVIILVSVYSIIPAKKNSIDWQRYSADLIPAKIDNKKGIIIDFYADWCIPCKELDAETFSDTKVIEEANNFYAFKADMTKSLSPEVDSLRNKFNILGVPTVIVINSQGKEVKRITGFIDAKQFYGILKNVK